MPVRFFKPEKEVTRIPAQEGRAFEVRRGDILRVRDPGGQQVADLFCFPADDLTDALSSGRSIDYNDTIRLTTGHVLYANSGRALMTIENDTCGQHDFLVTPCSLQMFRMIAVDDSLEHPSCFDNLAKSMKKFGVESSRITTTFNIFMNVPVHAFGRITVETPLSKPGDIIDLRAETDLIVGLTACSHEGSNGGICKPVEYEIIKL